MELPGFATNAAPGPRTLARAIIRTAEQPPLAVSDVDPGARRQDLGATALALGVNVSKRRLNLNATVRIFHHTGPRALVHDANVIREERPHALGRGAFGLVPRDCVVGGNVERGLHLGHVGRGLHLGLVGRGLDDRDVDRGLHLGLVLRHRVIDRVRGGR